ncbi:MAG: hypothetical protein RJA19_958, partial [Bacteroidota bacterium]
VAHALRPSSEGRAPSIMSTSPIASKSPPFLFRSTPIPLLPPLSVACFPCCGRFSHFGRMDGRWGGLGQGVLGQPGSAGQRRNGDPQETQPAQYQPNRLISPAFLALSRQLVLGEDAAMHFTGLDQGLDFGDALLAQVQNLALTGPAKEALVLLFHSGKAHGTRMFDAPVFGWIVCLHFHLNVMQIKIVCAPIRIGVTE